MSSSRFTSGSGRLEPTRITLARMASGLSKTALARELGVTPRTITTYETDGAPMDMAPLIAQAVGCQQSFLLKTPIDPLEQDRVFFRALRRSSASQRHAATAAGRLGIELYEWIANHFVLPKLDLPELDSFSPSAAAATVRSAWGLGDRPLPNLVQLAESKGIRVVGLPKSAEAVDAFSVWSDGQPYVFMCRAKTPERARFDLAHEIGHLLIHSRSGAVDAKLGDTIEREADRFASALLMPPESVSRSLRMNAGIDEILTFRSYYRVSAIALAYALHRAGRLSDYTYRQHCIRLSSMGFRSGELGGMPHHELSRIFPTVLSYSRDGRKLSSEKLANYLGILPDDLHALTLGSALVSTGGAQEITSDRVSQNRRGTLRAVKLHDGERNLNEG